jgi:hypothetical protein
MESPGAAVPWAFVEAVAAPWLAICRPPMRRLSEPV